MKKLISILFFATLIAFVLPSCSRGSGCPAETAQTETDKMGRYKSTKTKQHLFSSKRIKKSQKNKNKKSR